MLDKILLERHILGLTLWTYLESGERKPRILKDIAQENAVQISILKSLTPQHLHDSVLVELKAYASEGSPTIPKDYRDMLYYALKKETMILNLAMTASKSPEFSWFESRNLNRAIKSQKIMLESIEHAINTNALSQQD